MCFDSIYVQLLLIVFFMSRTLHTVCWKGSYGRGTGSFLNLCNEDQEQNGDLCYPKCKKGYYGIGPVCWEQCKNGYEDHGATCFKNSHIYGKGCCCSSFDVACCYKCTTGYKDDGCTCRKDVEVYFKKNYQRTVGTPLSCSLDLEKSGALCYPKCEEGYSGVGPVCWFNCVGNYSHDCGMFCSRNLDECTDSSLIVAAIPVASLVLLVPENKCD